MGTWSINPHEGVEPPYENSDGKFTFKPNTSYTERHFTVKYIDGGTKCSVPVIQKPKTCSCDNLTLNKSSISWAWNDTTSQEVEMSYESCITNIQKNTLSHFNVSDNDSGIITISPKGENTGTTPYEDTLTISYDALGVPGCTKDISLTQNVSTCDCPDLTVSHTSLEWAWNEVTPKEVSLSYECSDPDTIGLTLPSNPNFTALLNAARNKITITPNGENETTSPLTDTLTISYKSDYHNCSSAVTLTQNINSCNCDNLKLSPTSLSWEWDDTTAQPVRITADSCVNLNSITTSSTSSDFSVNRNGSIININPTSTTVDARSATITVSYTAGNHSCSSAITVHQDAKGCVCDCTYVKAVNNEEGKPFYIYPVSQNLEVDPPQPLTNVPFVILTASTTFECNASDIETEIVYGDIQSISCVEYNNSDTLWNGGWKDSYYQDFREYCNGLSQSSKVFIIYGTLKNIITSEPTVYGIKYKVCNNVCEDGKILRIFQRCACGMDNCRNEYTPTSTEIVVEDNPLYMNSCPSEYKWYDGDSICVHKLTVTGARVYKIDSATGEKIGGPIVSSSFTASDDTYVLRSNDPSITGSWNYNDPAICQGWFNDCSNWSTGIGNFWLQGKEINPNYIQWPKDSWDIDPGRTSLDHNRTLHLIEYTGSSVPEEDKIQVEIMISPNGIDHETPDECPSQASYDARINAGCLGKGMIQYEINAPDRRYERLIEIDYHTGEGEKMTAGDYKGRCALLDFTTTIYIAPDGYRYNKNDVDDKYKGKMYQC